MADGKVVNVSLGVTEVNAYLKFLRYRCRLNIQISCGHDLQIFLNFIEKPLIAVTPDDILHKYGEWLNKIVCLQAK
jgi:hypothetical protein